MTEAYPLQWPAGRPRTQRPTRSRFDTQMSYARDQLMNELHLLGARNIVLSTNIPVRQDGLPYANARQPDDPGAAVYFSYKGQQMCFACDRWDLVKDNVQAVRKTIEALRGIERWGTGDMVQAAFTGFQALPAPMAMQMHWSQILGVKISATVDEIEAAYRKLAKEHHPDTGGDPEKMARINEARNQARKERGQ